MEHKWVKWEEGCELPTFGEDGYSESVLVAYKRRDRSSPKFHSFGAIFRDLQGGMSWEIEKIEASCGGNYSTTIVLGWCYFNEFPF